MRLSFRQHENAADSQGGPTVAQNLADSSPIRNGNQSGAQRNPFFRRLLAATLLGLLGGLLFSYLFSLGFLIPWQNLGKPPVKADVVLGTDSKSIWLKGYDGEIYHYTVAKNHPSGIPRYEWRVVD
jgi:hypothetical protein